MFTEPGQPAPVASSSTTIAINRSTGAVSSQKALQELPKANDVNWEPPRIVAKASSIAFAPGTGEKVQLMFAQDGDSANFLKKDGSTLICRVDRIDAPETEKPKIGKLGQVYGQESKKSLQQLLSSGQISVKVTVPSVNGSNYGRDLCLIEVEGKNINLEMIKEGAAWFYDKYSDAPEYSAAQSEAKAKRKGLWANLNAQNPETFRHDPRNTIKPWK